MSTDSIMPELLGAGQRLCDAPHLLLGLDYDGTLTPLVDDPAEAALAPATRDAVLALSQRPDATIAVISGRTQDSVQKLVGIPNLIYAGNHGLEISGPNLSFIEPAAMALSHELHLLGEQISKRLSGIEGAFVEDKGLTLSVHYRRVAAPDDQQVWFAVRDVVAPQHHRFRVKAGNKVYDVRPMVHWNKGSAVAWIKAQITRRNSQVVYIGDDSTDEDAFLYLGKEAITIRVGDRPNTAAQFTLEDPAAVERFLRRLCQCRDRQPT